MSAVALRRAALPGALVLSLGLGLALPSRAQQGSDPTDPANRAAPAPAASGEVPAPLKAIGGFFGGMLGGSSNKPQIDQIKPGVYAKSNEAIGEDRDLAEMQISRGVVPMAAFTDYAQSVLDKLKAASGVSGVPGRVYVVASGELDAGATADGNVYLSVAYLRSFKSEDELAALLAHELAHVLLRHHDSNLFTRAQKQMSSWLAVGMGMRNTLDAMGANRAASAALTPNQQKALGELEVLIKFSDLALHPAWTRGQESEADRLGMDLLVRAGYSYSAGLLPWLEMVAHWDEQRAQRQAEQEARKQAALNTLFESGQFDQGLKQSLDAGVGQIIGTLSRTHKHGRERLADIDAYYIKVYQETVPGVAPRQQAYQAVVDRAAVKGVAEGYTKVFEARDLLLKGEAAKAGALLTPLLARNSPLAQHGLPNTLMVEALRATGKRREAEAYLARSSAWSPTTWDVYDNAALFEKERGKRDAARQIGKTAFEKFARAPSAYPRLIALYRRSGLPEDAQRVLGECKLVQADMRERCDEAARGS